MSPQMPTVVACELKFSLIIIYDVDGAKPAPRSKIASRAFSCRRHCHNFALCVALITRTTEETCTMAHTRDQPPQRVPLGLQSVFLASNRGNEVTTPPPKNVASRTYFGFRGKKAVTLVPFAPDLASPGRKPRMFTFASPKKAVCSPTKKGTKLVQSINAPVGVVSPQPTARCNGSPKKNVSSLGIVSEVESFSFVVSLTLSPSFAFYQSRLPTMSPQVYLDALMSNRGYCTNRINTVETAYYNTPTQLQKSSYHCFLIKVARSGNIPHFKSLMESGLSPNPANHFGESLCHMICRLGDNAMLTALLECGATLEVSDDYGRTPLHDACWASKPCFDVIDTIMTKMGNERYHLFNMLDKRGATPLSYIRQENWAEWMEFMVSKKDIYWPTLDKSNGKKGPPSITLDAPHSRPVPDPNNALTLDLASMVASGSILPMEARFLVDEDTEEFSEDSDESWEDLECLEYPAESYEDSSSDADFEDRSIDERTIHRMMHRIVDPTMPGLTNGDSSATLYEMAHILDCLNASRRRPISWCA
jgi:Ankyrin repeats (3 copies)